MKYFQLCQPQSLDTTIHPDCYNTKAAIDNTEVSACACVPIKLDT